jgi:hypothetical protein
MELAEGRKPAGIFLFVLDKNNRMKWLPKAKPGQSQQEYRKTVAERPG